MILFNFIVLNGLIASVAAAGVDHEKLEPRPDLARAFSDCIIAIEGSAFDDRYLRSKGWVSSVDSNDQNVERSAVFYFWPNSHQKDAQIIHFPTLGVANCSIVFRFDEISDIQKINVRISEYFGEKINVPGDLRNNSLNWRNKDLIVELEHQESYDFSIGKIDGYSGSINIVSKVQD